MCVLIIYEVHKNLQSYIQICGHKNLELSKEQRVSTGCRYCAGGWNRLVIDQKRPRDRPVDRDRRVNLVAYMTTAPLD